MEGRGSQISLLRHASPCGVGWWFRPTLTPDTFLEISRVNGASVLLQHLYPKENGTTGPSAGEGLVSVLESAYTARVGLYTAGYPFSTIITRVATAAVVRKMAKLISFEWQPANVKRPLNNLQEHPYLVIPTMYLYTYICRLSLPFVEPEPITK